MAQSDSRCMSPTGGFIDNSPNEWLQVDFGTHRCVTKTVTRGRYPFPQLIPTYKIQYWDDTLGDWATVNDLTGTPHVSYIIYLINTTCTPY